MLFCRIRIQIMLKVLDPHPQHWKKHNSLTLKHRDPHNHHIDLTPPELPTKNIGFSLKLSLIKPRNFYQSAIRWLTG
jgi:hypothetical protein